MSVRPILSLALVAALSGAAAPKALALPVAESARNAAATITEARARAHVEFLASDLLEGRSTPSRGLDIAAEYIEVHMKRLGLKPGGDDGTYFQRFPLMGERRLAEHGLALTSGGRKTSFELGKGYSPLPMSGSGAASGKLVFAGYGITAPDENYDDYDGLDVKGKVVLVLRHEPREKVAGDAFGGQRTTRYSYYASKVANAARRGAAALLIVTDPVNHETHEVEGQWPQQGGAEGMGGMRGMGGGGQDAPPPIPCMQISLEAAEALVGGTSGAKGEKLASIQRGIDEALKPASFDVDGAEVSLSVKIEEVPTYAKNVVAVLPGSDPELASEAIVYGAHYDHVGVEGPSGPTFYGQIGGIVNGDRIHNGADDNASGTSALMEVARAYAESGARPKRTVIFIAFAGEELGLLGSAYYVKHPLIPNEKTVAMLNMDMVGRNAADDLSLGGTRKAPALERALADANEVVGMKVTRMTDGRHDGDSDHASFTGVAVPSVFFFTGDHPDYHRVTDHADKIDGNKIARVARMAFIAGSEVADDPTAGEDRAGAQADLDARRTARRGRRNRDGQGQGERRTERMPEGDARPEAPKKDGAWF